MLLRVCCFLCCSVLLLVCFDVCLCIVLVIWFMFGLFVIGRFVLLLWIGLIWCCFCVGLFVLLVFFDLVLFGVSGLFVPVRCLRLFLWFIFKFAEWCLVVLVWFLVVVYVYYF